jgi:hypothetical protein
MMDQTHCLDIDMVSTGISHATALPSDEITSSAVVPEDQ